MRESGRTEKQPDLALAHRVAPVDGIVDELRPIGCERLNRRRIRARHVSDDLVDQLLVERFRKPHAESLPKRFRHHREASRIRAPKDVARLQPGRREHVRRERAVCLRRVGPVLVRPADCGANFQHREHSIPDRDASLCHLQERGIPHREDGSNDGLLRRLWVSRRYSRRASLRLPVAKQVERNLIRRQAVMFH